MQLWKLAPAALLALLALAARPASACDRCPPSLAGAKVAAVPAAAAQKDARTIEIAVTGDGFTPNDVKAKAGETVKLAVTRKVERTCATEIVMKDFGVNEKLPLGKTVVVTVKAQKPGAYRFACGMDMIAGTLHVE
jgi:plastocyanin domain-containing protein